MKYTLAILLFLSPFLIEAQVLKQLKKTIELKMPKTADDDNPGTRGASVAWHTVQKKYYAAMAGNSSYPIAVFDATGKRLSDDEANTMLDTRGLWYNTKTKTICGNGYGETGWFCYTLDSKGFPENADIVYEGENQPDAQSVGAFNPASGRVYFISGNEIMVYDKDAEPLEDSTITLYLGQSKKSNADGSNDEDEEVAEKYNNNVVIYTGQSKAEFGLLNYEDMQIELYDRKTGLMTKVYKLPDDAAAESAFNFSYTNGTFWLFNMDTRKWTGYK